MDTIRGPITQLVSGEIIYQVTLASGMIVTNPKAFGTDEVHLAPSGTIVSESGKILSMPKTGVKRKYEKGQEHENQKT